MSGPPATLSTAVGTLTRAFAEAGLEAAAREARLLVAAAAGVTAEVMLSHPDRLLDQAGAARVRDFCRRRLAREPVARILGMREFYGRNFEIGPDVLDPRADTETLIDLALSLADDIGSAGCDLRILDIGTGSGCIAVTLLAELTGATAVATDLSPGALMLARRNAAAHGVDGRLTLVETDLVRDVDGPFDLVVSNPPYVVRGDIATLAPEVRCHDPLLALDGGSDGLQFYRRIAAETVHLIAPGGWLAVEVGFGQAGDVEQLLWAVHGDGPPVQAAAARLRGAADLAGIRRCVAVKAHLVVTP